MANKTRYIYKHREQSLQTPSSSRVRGLYFVFGLLVLFIFSIVNNVSAQDTSTILTNKVPIEKNVKHSPRKATYYALVLPGLGQAYNHKYWKIPIVYAGFGTMIYFIHLNNKNYQGLKDAYEYESVTKKIVYPPDPVNIFHPIPDPPNEWATKGYSEDQLKAGRDGYRRNLEVSYIFTGVWYILTVVDAVVDAYFFDYDLNDDLTLDIKPWAPVLGSNTAYGVAGGLQLTLRF